MEPDREAPSRLDAAMDKRRLELRPPLKWNQVAEKAGLSIAHLARIRKGESPLSKMAASQIESALEWEPGTVARIMDDEALSTTPEVERPPAVLEGLVLPPHLADIEDPTPKEAAMLQYLASLQEQIRALDERIDAITREQDRGVIGGGTPHRKGA